MYLNDQKYVYEHSIIGHGTFFGYWKTVLFYGEDTEEQPTLAAPDTQILWC